MSLPIGKTQPALARVTSSPKALWLTAFAPTALLYFVTAQHDPSHMSPDVASVTASAWQLAHHGTAFVSVSAPHFDSWMLSAGNGHVVSNREPGLVLIGAVAYRIAFRSGPLDLWPASVAAALIAAAAVATLAVLMSRLVPPVQALAVAFLFATASTTWAVSSEALWPHGPTQLACLAALLALLDRRYVLGGVALGVGVLCRPPLFVVAVVWCVWILLRRRDPRGAVVVGSVASLGLAGVLLWSHVYWGGGLAAGYGAVGSDYLGRLQAVDPTSLLAWAVNILGSLVSPGRGVLFGAPMLLWLLPGVGAAWRVAPSWVRCSAVSGVLYLLLQLKLNRFGGGAAFWSYRYQLSTVTLCVPLLVIAWREWTARSPRRRAGFFVASAVTVSLQALGALAFRRTSTNWWSFDDLAAAVHDSPLVALVVFSAAGVVPVAAWVVVRGSDRRAMRRRQLDLCSYTVRGDTMRSQSVTVR